MKMQYEYMVGVFNVNTREAARMVQRSLKRTQLDQSAPAPKIVQKLTMERVVR